MVTLETAISPSDNTSNLGSDLLHFGMFSIEPSECLFQTLMGLGDIFNHFSSNQNTLKIENNALRQEAPPYQLTPLN